MLMAKVSEISAAIQKCVDVLIETEHGEWEVEFDDHVKVTLWRGPLDICIFEIFPGIIELAELYMSPGVAAARALDKRSYPTTYDILD